MPVILYARVSTNEQAEKELSIPAQLRALERYVHERGWYVAATYQDIGSGRSLKERPGLMAATRHACEDSVVDTLVVHRVDRLARNTYDYLTLKWKLRKHGVRLVSVVERFESNAMGDFLEHIMAAQAEFYSANLSLEVKKGMEERLRRGKWLGMLPIGYCKRGDTATLDPKSAPAVRLAFERWATGTVTCEQLARELHEVGLAKRDGTPLRPGGVSQVLKNPFYRGLIVVNGKIYPGMHPPIVAPQLFERCEAVFQQKRSGGRPQRRLRFLLARLVSCPRCASTLVGERTTKPRTGKEYFYYRCHGRGCGFSAHAGELEQDVVDHLRSVRVAELLVPTLRRGVSRARRQRAASEADRVRDLRAERRRIDAQLKDLAASYALARIHDETYDIQRAELTHALRATEHLLAHVDLDRAHGEDEPRTLAVAESLNTWLDSPDVVTRRQAVAALVKRIALVGTAVQIELAEPWRDLLAGKVRTSS